LFVFGWLARVGFAAKRGQAGDQEHGQQAHQRGPDRAKRPKPVRDQDIKREGHHGADGEDGGHGLPKAFPAGAENGDDAGDRDVREREKRRHVRSDLDARDSGDADEAFKSGCHRAKSDSPTVSYSGQNHSNDWIKAQDDQDWCANSHWHAKSTHALQEGGEEEGNGEHLQAAVAGKVRDRVADHADGSDFVRQAVE